MGGGLNGELVHACRCALGLTVAALADRVGVHTDVLWAIERGDERRLEQLPLVTLATLADSLDLYPNQLFAESEPSSAGPPAPDDVMLEAALLENGGSVTREDLAVAFGWPLARVDTALAALHQRLASTGARLHPVGVDRYAVAPNHRALTANSGSNSVNPAAAKSP